MSQPITSNDLRTIFVQFASGFDDLPARRRYLLDHPELVSQAAIDAANASILDWRERGFPEASLIRLRLFRNLLQRAMVVGIEPACQEFTPAPPEVVEAVIKFLRAGPGQDSFTLLAVERQQLTSPKASGAFNFLRAKFEDDPDQLRIVDACWDAIGMFRDDPTPH